MTTPVSKVDLMEGVCRLTDKIYREMLCIAKHEKMTFLTIRGLSAFSWTPQYRIVLSWDLLAWIMVEDKILCSFTNFITIPRVIWSPVYQPGHLSYPTYGIFTVSLFFFAWNIFLIVILLVTPITFSESFQSGAFGNIFPLLFQLK